MRDMERELEAESLDRIMRTRSREEAELADQVNAIRAPWMSGAASEKNIKDDLDKLLEEDGR